MTYTPREYEFTIPVHDFKRSISEAFEGREYAGIVLDFLDGEGCVIRTMGFQLPKNPSVD